MRMRGRTARNVRWQRNIVLGVLPYRRQHSGIHSCGASFEKFYRLLTVYLPGTGAKGAGKPLFPPHRGNK